MSTAGRKDQRRRESRRDVLTYTSPVLTDDLTVIGPLTASLYVRSSLEHTDFFLRLCDVTAKGKSHNLSTPPPPPVARVSPSGAKTANQFSLGSASTQTWSVSTKKKAVVEAARYLPGAIAGTLVTVPPNGAVMTV